MLFLYRPLLVRPLLSFAVPGALGLDAGFARASAVLYQPPLPSLAGSESTVSAGRLKCLNRDCERKLRGSSGRQGSHKLSLRGRTMRLGAKPISSSVK